MTLRRAAWILVGLAALGLVLFLVWRPVALTPPSGAIAIGGPFQLTDQSGRGVDQRVLKGKWSAVFFGYTFCPDVCPTTLQTLAVAQQGLGARAKDFQVVFVTVDPARRRVSANGEPIDLTATEFELLEFLCRRPGRVFPREHLLSEVWGYAAAAGTRTVDVHVAQLRAKLGDASPIRTVRGVGYSADA